MRGVGFSRAWFTAEDSEAHVLSQEFSDEGRSVLRSGASLRLYVCVGSASKTLIPSTVRGVPSDPSMAPLVSNKTGV